MNHAQIKSKNLPIAIILAGGKSERMGGRHKCLLKLGNQSILERIVRLLEAQTQEILLNINDPIPEFHNFGMPLIKDQYTKSVGPLAGIAATMQWLRQYRTHSTHLLVVTNDCPFLPENLVSELISQYRNTDKIIHICCGKNDHYLLGLWPVAFEEKINQYLESGKRSVKGFLAYQTPEKCFFDENPHDPFFNINSPEDYQHALTLFNKINKK